MAEYKTELDPVGSGFERETDECPVCSGTVREMRNGDRWICDDCARYWDTDDLKSDTQ